MSTTIRRSSRAQALVMVAGFGLAACGASGMNVPPELSSATHYEVKSKGRLFSGTSQASFGPHAFQAKASRSEEEAVIGAGTRKTKTVSLTLSLTTAESPPLEATCVDTFAYTHVEAKLLSEDVVDTFECEGSGWSMSVAPSDGNGYSGVFSSAAGETAVRSQHGRFAGMQGALEGYALGDHGGAIVAVRQARNGKPAEVWSAAPETDRAPLMAVLALLLFSEGE